MNCWDIMFFVSSIKRKGIVLLYYFNWELPNKMKPADLDMDELFGLTVVRKNKLFLIPTIYEASWYMYFFLIGQRRFNKSTNDIQNKKVTENKGTQGAKKLKEKPHSDNICSACLLRYLYTLGSLVWCNFLLVTESIINNIWLSLRWFFFYKGEVFTIHCIIHLYTIFLIFFSYTHFSFNILERK